MKQSCYTVSVIILVGVLAATHGDAADAGFIGPGESEPSTVGKPPYNPATWRKVKGDVLSLDQVWGRRAKPQGIFE